jgi:SAM-dependent methyltransferase
LTDSGFRIRDVIPPGIPGYQWQIFIEPRTDDADDALPTLEELKAGLCAAPSDESELRAVPHKVKEVVAEPKMPVTAPPPETERKSETSDPARRIVLNYRSGGDAQEFRQRVADSESWYHSYYFDNGFYVRGDYDIGADVAEYGFPESMEGMRVLDIGSGAGWFSHYFEQLGGAVTAVDARGYEDFDVYGRAGYPEVTRPPDRYHEGRPIHFSPVNQQFWIMKDLLGSRIQFFNARVYEVGAQVLKGEKFDLVFLGALLCHLRDPIGALQAARSVCSGRVMASTPVVIGEPAGEVQPRQYLPYTEYDRISWWLPNEECFERWFKAAGFRDVSAGPQVRLRSDKVRYREDGQLLNESQWIRVGSGVV